MSASQSESLLCQLGNEISSNTIWLSCTFYCHPLHCQQIIILETHNSTLSAFFLSPLPSPTAYTNCLNIQPENLKSILLLLNGGSFKETFETWKQQKRIFSLVCSMRHRSEIILTPPLSIMPPQDFPPSIIQCIPSPFPPTPPPPSISHPTCADLNPDAIQERRAADSDEQA